jgi:hypothetical protein
MAEMVATQKCKSRTRVTPGSSSVNRAVSERPKRKAEAEWMCRGSSRPIPENLTYLLMKDKF